MLKLAELRRSTKQLIKDNAKQDYVIYDGNAFGQEVVL